MEPIETYLIQLDDSLESALRTIDRGARGIALVVDSERRLVNTLTDGDVRRAILHGHTLQAPVQAVLEDKAAGPARKEPIIASPDTSEAELLHLMLTNKVAHVPLVDTDGRVQALTSRADLVQEYETPIEAVVMAGGKGTRLLPLTKETPKPMLPVGGRPVLEHIVGNLRKAGITRVNLATHFREEKIAAHFGDGSDFGVEIEYVSEREPLGTAGAIGLVKSSEQPLLVMNGDIVTQIDFRALAAYHREHGAALTVAVRQYDLKVPYGVIEVDGPRVCGLKEKPVLNFMVNAGIYLLEPSVRKYIPQDQPVDMTEVIETLLEAGQTVVSFPIVEYWLDIGRPDDYAQAQQDVAR